MKKFLVLLLTAISVSALAQDVHVDCSNVNPCTLTPGGGLPWSDANQTWIFSPISPTTNVFVYIHNRNPNNPHTFALAIYQTGFSRNTAPTLSNNGDLWIQANLAQNTNTSASCNALSGNIPALSVGGCYAGSIFAAQIAIKISTARSASGSPDAFDLSVVQQTGPASPATSQDTNQTSEQQYITYLSRITGQSYFTDVANAALPGSSLTIVSAMQNAFGTGAQQSGYSNIYSNPVTLMIQDIILTCTTQCEVQLEAGSSSTTSLGQPSTTPTAGTATVQLNNNAIGASSANPVYRGFFVTSGNLTNGNFNTSNHIGTFVLAANTPFILPMYGFTLNSWTVLNAGGVIGTNAQTPCDPSSNFGGAPCVLAVYACTWSGTACTTASGSIDIAYRYWNQ